MFEYLHSLRSAVKVTRMCGWGGNGKSSKEKTEKTNTKWIIHAIVKKEWFREPFPARNDCFYRRNAKHNAKQINIWLQKTWGSDRKNCRNTRNYQQTFIIEVLIRNKHQTLCFDVRLNGLMNYEHDCHIFSCNWISTLINSDGTAHNWWDMYFNESYNKCDLFKWFSDGSEKVVLIWVVTLPVKTMITCNLDEFWNI